MEYLHIKKELIKELMPEIENRMEKKMKLIAMNVLKGMLEERRETYLTMKLSEDSFEKLWDNKDMSNRRFVINDESDDSSLDEIWDQY